MQVLSLIDCTSRLGATHYNNTLLGAILSILPPFDGNRWLGGGCLRRLLLEEHEIKSDLDFFFRNMESATKFIQSLEDNFVYCIKVGKNQTSIYITINPDYYPDDLLKNKIRGYKDGMTITIQIQIITLSYYDSPEQLINSFDFTICQFATDGEYLYCGDYSLWDLGRKKLAPNKISFAVSSLRRMLKYVKQGFSPCSGGLSNILEQVVACPEIIHKETDYID